jgi:general secretion pathway protein I
MNAYARYQGFTLLEVLIAFVIVSMSMGVLYQIYARGTTSAILGKEYATAIAIAESRLAELRISKALDHTALSGIENNKYQWEITITDYTDDTAQGFETPLQLKEVEFKVYWDSRGKQRLVSLHSLRPVPAQ